MGLNHSTLEILRIFETQCNELTVSNNRREKSLDIRYQNWNILTVRQKTF